MLEPSPSYPRPHPLHGGETSEADHGPPSVANQPAQEEDFPVAASHAAEAAAPQINGDDEGIELDREQDAGDGITLAQLPTTSSEMAHPS